VGDAANSKADLTYIATVVAKFHRQPQRDNCAPTCFKNILDELASRQSSKRARKRLRFSLRALDKMFNYRAGGFCDSELGVENLNTALLGSGYHVVRVFGQQSGLDRLHKTVASPARSYVVAAVSTDYFSEQGKGYDVRGDPKIDHALIVLTLDAQSVTFFDPYEYYYAGKTVKTSTLPIVKFNKYWQDAESVLWMAWAEPVARTPIEETPPYGGSE
jgi:hypothetical protein